MLCIRVSWVCLVCCSYARKKALLQCLSNYWEEVPLLVFGMGTMLAMKTYVVYVPDG